MAKGHGLLIAGGVAAVAYFTRNSWLPAVEADFPSLFGGATIPAPPATAQPVAGSTAIVYQPITLTNNPARVWMSTSGATGNPTGQPTNTTSNQPISTAVPGAFPLHLGPRGPGFIGQPGATPPGALAGAGRIRSLSGDGCWSYGTGTSGSAVTNCPPGVNPPPTTPAMTDADCAQGFTMDATGICTRQPDNFLLARINSVPWTGLSDITPAQIQNINAGIFDVYTTTTGINAGTALSHVMGLPPQPQDGTMWQGNDSMIYKALGGVYYRQGTATHQTLSGKLRGLGAAPVSAALPITNAVLVMASADPSIAALVGRDQRAMLTAAQWNAYYTQATGVVQGIHLHPGDMQGALMSAAQYQARRRAAGLQTTTNLGTLRPARRGAFPLGFAHMGLINQWVPPGNRTIFQIPGRGAVPAGRGGRVPAPRMGLISDGGGDHRWARSPFPRPVWWREAE